MDPTDPLTFLILLAIAIVVIVGFYFALRELISDAIILADKKREEQKQQRKDKQ